jgi:hypothetical protein
VRAGGGFGRRVEHDHARHQILPQGVRPARRVQGAGAGSRSPRCWRCSTRSPAC